MQVSANNRVLQRQSLPVDSLAIYRQIPIDSCEVLHRQIASRFRDSQLKKITLIEATIMTEIDLLKRIGALYCLDEGIRLTSYANVIVIGEDLSPKINALVGPHLHYSNITQGRLRTIADTVICQMQFKINYLMDVWQQTRSIPLELEYNEYKAKLQNHIFTNDTTLLIFNHINPLELTNFYHDLQKGYETNIPFNYIQVVNENDLFNLIIQNNNKDL